MGPAFCLKQLLRSICHGSFWNYAVFWRIKSQNNMFMAWEDGYCKPADSSGNTTSNDFIVGASKIISFGSEMDAQCRYSSGCLIEKAMTNMSSCLYTSGEGVVGHVAFTGNHFWISVNSSLVKEYPEEWWFQIAVGIKTVLLVPVQHGVVQLGSLEMVEENPNMVAQIQHLFFSIQDTTDSYAKFASGGNTTTGSRGSQLLVADGSPNPLQSGIQRKKHRLGFDVNYVSKKERSDIGPHLCLPYITQDSLLPQVDMDHTVRVNSEVPSKETSTQKLDSCSVPAEQDLHILDPCIDNAFLAQSSGFAPEGISFTPSQYYDDQILFTEQSTFVNSCKTPLENGKHDTYVGKEMGRPFASDISDTMFHDSVGSMLESSPDSKLHDASGLPLSNGIDDCFWNPAFYEDELGSSMDLKMQDDSPFFADFNEFLMDKNVEEQLFDAVVYNPTHSSDENPQTLSGCTNSSSNSSGNLGGFYATQNKPDVSGHLDSHDHIKSRYVANTEAFTSSPIYSSSNGGSILINEDKKSMAPKFGSTGIKKPLHIGKKKTKASVARKPRPRDRQLIQDRVKELRELVPHGEKCSIDALLDRAIKHMLFLRSVSIQAEKLKDCAHPKVSDENKASSETLNNQNVVTWEYELGSKPETCPILVEHLEQPGHMLVEMLCTEYGDFLEIAHVIRHSELVILKGVMESRSDKLWACFIVEASRGFDKMDILWPLMRLMQQIRGPFRTRC